jgi:hypothetical protein
LLTLPSERALHNHQAVIDVFDIHRKREITISQTSELSLVFLIMNSIASKNATSSMVSASIIKDNHSFTVTA